MVQDLLLQGVSPDYLAGLTLPVFYNLYIRYVRTRPELQGWTHNTTSYVEPPKPTQMVREGNKRHITVNFGDDNIPFMVNGLQQESGLRRGKNARRLGNATG